ncbi:MAG: nitroreductase family protein [Acidobacteriota bacterium]|nr:nitroreductase family protein [Acidobacteriota bacterium]
MSTSDTPASQLSENPVKVADTLPGVHDLIRSRWSPRAFSDHEVSAEDLRTVLDAARWAASSSNEQPWRFLTATKADAPAFQKLLDLLVPANQSWAKTASVLLITAAKKTFSRDGSPNRHGMHDAGQALANLFLQATALGLHAHAMAGFDHEKARQKLAIPDDFEVAAAVALGYLGSPDELSGKYRDMEVAPRQRKPLDEIAFGSSWNVKLP